jgi:glycoside hydrolase family 25
MKKFVLGLIVMLFCCSCGKNIAVVSPMDNLVFEYGDKIVLDNLVSIKDGYLINGNKEYDYKDVGEQKVTIDYRDTKKHKGKYDVTINIVDSVKPILSISNNLYVLKDNGIDVCKRAFYADNADRNVACQVMGDIDTTKEGKYKVNVKVTDASGNYVDKDVVVNVIEKFEETPEVEIVPDKIEDMILKYKTEDTLIGIDVSNHQGDIDWETVKNSGVEFAFIRIGYGHNREAKIMEDEKFRKNLEGARNVGLKVGLYFYSYATEIWEAEEQANWIVKTLNGEKIDLPIVFDYETWKSFPTYNINIVDLNKVAKRFLDILHGNGYEGMNYSSKYYLNTIWNLSEYPTWLAHYVSKTNYDKDFKVWQFSNTGEVPGINGFVDLDVLYLEG